VEVRRRTRLRAVPEAPSDEPVGGAAGGPADEAVSDA
jgi:hypothetical protein